MPNTTAPELSDTLIGHAHRMRHQMRAIIHLGHTIDLDTWDTIAESLIGDMWAAAGADLTPNEYAMLVDFILTELQELISAGF